MAILKSSLTKDQLAVMRSNPSAAVIAAIKATTQTPISTSIQSSSDITALQRNTLFNPAIRDLSKGYKVIISYLKDIGKTADGKSQNLVTEYAELDFQEGDVKVDSEVELTTHPTANGYDISDHIYRKPITASLQGVFADNGLKSVYWTGSDRLTTIQREFEALQRLGCKFTITIMKGADASDTANQRYISRQNMVLTKISWNEAQDTLHFNFDFREAISSNVVLLEPEVNVRDPNLPAITELKATSLIDEVISKDDIIKITIKALYDLDLVDDKTLKYVAAANITALVSGIAAGAVVLSILMVAAGLASIPIVGWIIGAVLAVAAAIVSAICWWKAAEHERQLAYYKSIGHMFKVTDDMTDEQKDAIIKVLGTFLEEVFSNVETALQDVKVYNIAKDDRQECTLEVNGNYYVQQIEKSNTSDAYTVKSLYLGETEIKQQALVGRETFQDCTDDSSTIYFRDKDDEKYRVYIINKAAVSETESGTSADETLMNYDFAVSKYPLSDMTDKIAKVVKDTIK